MQLQFLLDTTDYGHPINWRDLKIKYSRDKEVRGLFTTYTSELTFTGAAYEYIKSVFVAGYCNLIVAEINYRCSAFDSWALLMEGISLIRDIKLDDQMCTASMTVEQANGIGTFYKNIEKGFDWPEVTPGVTEVNAALSTEVDSGVALVPAVTGKVLFAPVFDIFEGLVNIASGGLLGFKSDYFSAPSRPQIMRLNITNPPALGEFMNITVTDIWGHDWEYQVESDGTVMGFGVDADVVLSASDVYLPYNAPLRREGGFAEVLIVGVNTWDLYLHFGHTITTFTIGTGTGTLTTTQSWQDGAGQDCMVLGSAMDIEQIVQDSLPTIVMGPGANRVSFKTFFKNLSVFHDLGMEFYNDAGTWKVRVEPIDYFFDPTPVVVLRNIKEIIKTAQTKLFGEYYIFGMTQENIELDSRDWFRPIVVPSSWSGTELKVTGEECVEEAFIDRRNEKNFYPVYGFTVNQMILGAWDLDKDGFFFVRASTATGIIEYQLYNFTPLSTLIKVYAVYWGVPFLASKAYYNHRNSVGPTTYYKGVYNRKSIVGPTYSINISETPVSNPEGYAYSPIKWMFKRYISTADFVAITSSQQLTLNEGSDIANDVDAFILSVEYKLSNGETAFELEAKS